MAQEGALYPYLDVRANVGFGLSRSERKATARVRRGLDLVGLSEAFALRRPHELSGGEQRRVPWRGRWLLDRGSCCWTSPSPASTPHCGSRRAKLVLTAFRGAGTTAVLVTHDQGEALSMGDQVALLRDGRLVQTATPAALYENPADLDVARFVGEAVVLSGHADAGVVSCALGRLPVLGPHVEGSVSTLIRPEQIGVRCVDPTSSAPSAERGVVARVVGRTYYGPETILCLALVDAVEASSPRSSVTTHPKSTISSSSWCRVAWSLPRPNSCWGPVRRSNR